MPRPAAARRMRQSSCRNIVQRWNDFSVARKARTAKSNELLPMQNSQTVDALLPPDQLKPAVALAHQLLEQLDRLLLGQSQLHRLVLVGILSRGHVLLEGVPGVGKTALVKALAQLLGLDFKRVQSTPDVIAGDILDTHILQDSGSGSREMSFRSGPVFTTILLADEISRASPKPQSALLEAMQERCVTLLG